MLVKEAREIARQWVFEYAASEPGFLGAFFAGSTNWKPDDMELPPASDVDVKVVIEDLTEYRGYHKSIYDGVLIEVSYMSSEKLKTPEMVLSSYPFAKHFTVANVIADPTGHLSQIQAGVRRDYARRQWVQARVEGAKGWMESQVDWFSRADRFCDQVFEWLYAFGIASHVILMADLRDPTVRQMFTVSADVLAKYGHQSFHETMLALLGSADMNQAQVEALLAACIETFERAKLFTKTDFFGATNVSDQGRPTVVEGTQEMIDRGYHREAAFWIAWNHTLCQKVLANDAPPEVQAECEPRYQQLLGSIGIHSSDDLHRRYAQFQAFVPQLMETVEAIIAANPEIVD